MTEAGTPNSFSTRSNVSRLLLNLGLAVLNAIVGRELGREIEEALGEEALLAIAGNDRLGRGVMPSSAIARWRAG